MEAISSQSGNDKDNKHDPGPFMRRILEAKNNNTQTTAVVETEERDDDHTRREMGRKEPEKDLNWYLPLYRAALNGDWESARKFFDQDPNAVTAKITKVSETALHIAVGTGKAETFVKELLELIPAEALVTLQDQAGQTALHYAAIFGNVESAKLLVAKDPGLANTKSASYFLPIRLAALYANKDMVSYLLTVTRDDLDQNTFADKSGLDILNLVILAEFYDLALYLVQLYPNLATLKSPAGNTALSMIAGKSSAFYKRNSLSFWQRFIYSCIPEKFGSIFGQEERDQENLAATTYTKCFHCPPFLKQLSVSVRRKWQSVVWKFIYCLAPQARTIRDMKMMNIQTLQLVKCLCKAIARLDYSTAASMFNTSILLGASLGNIEVVEEILEFFPPAILPRNGMGQNIFLLAVINRRENIFNLSY